nr:hypothetical protein P5646_02625 [Bacillus velezensis]
MGGSFGCQSGRRSLE